MCKIHVSRSCAETIVGNAQFFEYPGSDMPHLCPHGDDDVEYRDCIFVIPNEASKSLLLSLCSYVFSTHPLISTQLLIHSEKRINPV
jgi:hypothetical protein